MNTVVTSVAGREKEKGRWRRGVWGCGVQVYASYSVKQMKSKRRVLTWIMLRSISDK